MDKAAGQKSLTYLDLCCAMKDSEAPFSDHKMQLRILKDYVISTFSLQGKISVEENKELEKNLRFFLARAIGLYKKDSHKHGTFIIKNSTFLQKTFQLPDSLQEIFEDSAEDQSPKKSGDSKRPRLGRKPVPFDEKSTRAQQYASAKVRELHEPGAIILAASQQQSPLGQLVKKTKSPSGRTAGLALQAIKLPSVPGT